MPPPPPPTVLPALPDPPQSSTSCREYDTNAHLRHALACKSIQRTTSPSAHPGRRGTRFGRSITPPRSPKRVRFTPPSATESSPHTAYSIHVTRESTYGVAGGGANISVVNPATAARFRLIPQFWPRPFDIVFGNNSRFTCTQFVDFGPVLGQVALVDNAPDTLISIGALADRSYETRFNRDLGLASTTKANFFTRGVAILALTSSNLI
jgi:hypothetical protein